MAKIWLKQSSNKRRLNTKRQKKIKLQLKFEHEVFTAKYLSRLRTVSHWRKLLHELFAQIIRTNTYSVFTLTRVI